MKKSAFISVVLFLLVGVSSRGASSGHCFREMADSLSAGSADTSSTLMPGIGFNAMDYSMQKRFRPRNTSSFLNEKFTDNTFLHVTGGQFRFLDSQSCSGASAGIHYGKWFLPNHAFRLGAGFAFGRDNHDSRYMGQAFLRLSYMFDLISYIYGYDTSRFCVVSFVTGPGYALVRNSGVTGHSFTSHIGANVSMRVFRTVDVFWEPLFEIYTGSSAIPQSGTRKRVVCAFSGSVGLSCRFAQDNVSAPPASENWFLFLSGGIQFQNSSAVYRKIGLGNALGMHLNAGVGKWCRDFLALRLSAFYSDCKWMKYYAGNPLPELYAGVRFEGQLDLVSLVRGRKCRFSSSVLLGPEVGFFSKTDLNGKLSDLYVGLSTGLQANLKIASGVSLFVEPRLSIVPYSAPSDDATLVDAYRNYYDSVISVNVGLQYDL